MINHVFRNLVPATTLGELLAHGARFCEVGKRARVAKDRVDAELGRLGLAPSEHPADQQNHSVPSAQPSRRMAK